MNTNRSDIYGFSSAQIKLAVLILALAAARIFYMILVNRHLEQTAALFVGLPAVIAIVITLTPRTQSLTGMIIKGITIGVLASGILLREGIVCMLMALPIFYLVGGAIGKAREKSRDGGTNALSSSVMAVIVVLFSLEGVVPAFTFARAEEVTVTRIVAASALEVEQVLAATPRFDRALPLFLRLGFPTPLVEDVSGSGLTVGDQRVVPFQRRGQHMGDLVFAVTQHADNYVRFTRIADDTKISEWLRWQEAEVAWQELSEGQTEVRWTLRYERLLDPAWYFGPLERYGVKVAAGHLVDTLATPRGEAK